MVEGVYSKFEVLPFDDEGWTIVTWHKRKTQHLQTPPCPRLRRHQMKSKPKAEAKKKKKRSRKSQAQKVLPANPEDVLKQPPRIPVTLLEFMPKEFLQQECIEVHVFSYYVVHEDETSEDNVENMSDADFVCSDNEEQILGKNLLKYLKGNPEVEEKSFPTSSKLDLNTSCMATITFINEDLQLGSHPHNRPLYVTGYMLEHKIRGILLDCGSVVNLMPIRTMRQIGISTDELAHNKLMIQGFN